MSNPKAKKAAKPLKEQNDPASTSGKPKPSKGKKAAAPEVDISQTPGVGRPTSFKPEYVKQVVQLCNLGATDSELADFFEVTLRTISRWKVTHPEFAEAIHRGKTVADDRVEDSLYHRALGSEVEEELAFKLRKVNYSGGQKVSEEEKVEKVVVKRVIPADTTAAIFWLKNRRQQQWRDVHKHEHGSANEFDNKTDAELDEIIKQGSQEVLPDLLLASKPNRPTTKH